MAESGDGDLLQIQKEIRNQIESILKANRYNPSKCREKCLRLLDRKCAKGAELDPREHEKSQAACNCYGYAAHRFLDSGFSAAAQEILISAWHKFQKIQKTERTYIYKAGISVYLSDIYHRLGDIGASIRWALITQAYDALVDHVKGGAQQRLQEIFGMTSEALDALNKVAAENVSLALRDGKVDWSNPSVFAEDVLMQFVLKHQKFASIFAYESSIREFPLSKEYFTGLLSRTERILGSGKRKHFDGNALEDLACYLFLLIPSWVPRRNVKSVNNEFESDIIVANQVPTSNLNAELFGRTFLVECKNWKRPVGTNQVGYFLYRMRLTHTKFGVIFAKKGITGERDSKENSSDATEARSLINRAFHEDGSICIVINHAELKELARTQSSFWSLLLEKARQVQFGISNYG